MKKFLYHLPVSEMQVGDSFRANIPKCSGVGSFEHKCYLREIVGNILRVKIKARKGLVPILRSQVIESYGVEGSREVPDGKDVK